MHPLVLARHVRHDDVFRDCHRRAERKLLMDDDHARRAAVEERGETRRLAELDPGFRTIG